MGKAAIVPLAGVDGAGHYTTELEHGSGLDFRTCTMVPTITGRVYWQGDDGTRVLAWSTNAYHASEPRAQVIATRQAGMQLWALRNHYATKGRRWEVLQQEQRQQAHARLQAAE